MLAEIKTGCFGRSAYYACSTLVCIVDEAWDDRWPRPMLLCQALPTGEVVISLLADVSGEETSEDRIIDLLRSALSLRTRKSKSAPFLSLYKAEWMMEKLDGKDITYLQEKFGESLTKETLGKPNSPFVVSIIEQLKEKKTEIERIRDGLKTAANNDATNLGAKIFNVSKMIFQLSIGDEPNLDKVKSILN